MKDKIRTAIEEQQICFRYQAIAKITPPYTEVGLESLSCLKIGGKVIHASDFIDVAESLGLVKNLDEYSLVTNLIFAKNSTVPIAINLSQQSWNNPYILELLKQDTVKNIELEITERSLFDSDSIEAISQLSQYAPIVLDDFGDDYSCLNLLHRLPIQKIKIGYNFTRYWQEKKMRSIVANVVNMAHDLGLVVCAEAVETIEQLEWLATINCDLVQGFSIDAICHRS